MKQRLNEVDFLRVLEEKSLEEKRVLATEVMPKWARGIGEWLVVHPWRMLIPMACLLYLVFRYLLGDEFRELVLRLFGGFS